MLQAMNTGHEGSLTTIHANSPRDALSRLETLKSVGQMAPRDYRESWAWVHYLLNHSNATKTSLSDLAWAYFHSRPDTKKMELDYHISANLMKGTEEAYRWLGVDWPNNRYLLISLSGEMDKHPKNVAVKGLADWKCRYDLKTGKFDVPAMFAKGNVEALNWEIKR